MIPRSGSSRRKIPEVPVQPERRLGRAAMNHPAHARIQQTAAAASHHGACGASASAARREARASASRAARVGVTSLASRSGPWPPIEDALLRGSRLVTEIPEIAEMDLSPLRVRSAGRGAIVLDARIGVRPLDAGSSPG
jgi:hypothetical protein